MLDWIKEHPFLAVGLGGGGLILWLLFRNSGSSSAPAIATSNYGGVSDSVQQTELAAGVQLQGAQIAANAQTTQLNAALANAQLQAGVTNNQTAAALAATEGQTTAQLTLGLASGTRDTSSILALLEGQINPIAGFRLISGLSNVPGGGGSPATGNPVIATPAPPASAFTPTPTQPFQQFPNNPYAWGNAYADQIAVAQQSLPVSTASVHDPTSGSLICPSGYVFQRGAGGDIDRNTCYDSNYSASAAADLASALETFGHF